MKLEDTGLEENNLNKDIDTDKERRKNKRHKRRERRKAARSIFMKLGIVAVLMLAIVVILIGYVYKNGLIEGFGGSPVEEDRAALFNITDENEVGLLFNGEYIDTTGILKDGTVYLPVDFVLDELNSDYYYNENEKQLLFSTPTETKSWTEDDGLLSSDDVEYVSLDVVKKYTNLDTSDVMENPTRMVIRNEWGEDKEAEVKADTAGRSRASTKSEWITKLSGGDKVRVVSEDTTWSAVETADGYRVLVKNSSLGEFEKMDEAEADNAEKLDYTSIKYDGKVILGWHGVSSADGNVTLGNYMANAKGMTVIAPTWFSLTDTSGNFSNYSAADYVNTAHNAGLKVWAVADNFNASGFSAGEDTYKVLSNTETRQALASNLVNACTAVGADGINIDFEYLTGETGLHFAQFVRELSVACRNSGIVLSIDNYVPEDYNAMYHREVQGKVADYVVIMGYDEHTSGSAEAGTVASLPFVQQGIERTKEEVDPSKIINGLPFFTRIWKSENGTLDTSAVGMDTASQYIVNHGMQTAWDETTGYNYAEGTDGSTYVQIWLEDNKSIAAKLNMMEQEDIAGAAFWKLGLENSSVWDKISQYAAGETVSAE
ncbi:MAG: hypothetical protein K6F39_06540 [Lachnospiraceae bacterium]|nr:hypothetical protein [Lachnospiraceae bacterium]